MALDISHNICIKNISLIPSLFRKFVQKTSGALRVGLNWPHKCQVGSCGRCKCFSTAL